MRKLYAERQKILIAEIEKNLGEFVEVKSEEAGMHLIAWLKKNLSDKEITKIALETGLQVAPLSFYCINAKLPDGLILGYTGINRSEIREGVRSLQTVFCESI